MASNKSLITDIEALAAEMEIEGIVTDGLNNAALASLASDLKAKKRDAENETQLDDLENETDDSNETDDTVVEGEVLGAQGYIIADGKSVTSKRGIRAERMEVTAGDFPGGEETLQNLIKRGVVVKA